MSTLLHMKREDFFDRPYNNQELLAAVKPSFEVFVREIQAQDSSADVKASFSAAAVEATKSPKALYRFFQLYNYVNAEIASTIASLVGNIGKSRDVFIDPTLLVRDEADYSFEVANWVKTAAIDEYEDPSLRDVHTDEGVSHRLLASGLLKAIGNYAGLTAEERNQLVIPDWLIKLGTDIQDVYSGREDSRSGLASGIGAHLFSEYSADEIEFSHACKVLFIDNKNQGFHGFLQKNPLVTLQGKTFAPASWLMTHGSYDEEKGIVHGVEHVHLENAFIAAAVMVTKALPEQRQKIVDNIYEGISRCRTLLGRFFDQAQKECRLMNG